MVAKANGELEIDRFADDPAQETGCSFERIYFSRGNDPDIYAERKTLGALLVKCTSAPQEFIIRQGDDMGRPSCIEVDAQVEQVTIGGSAVAVMEGQLL